jgi:hypothetical protein
MRIVFTIAQLTEAMFGKKRRIEMVVLTAAHANARVPSMIPISGNKPRTRHHAAPIRMSATIIHLARLRAKRKNAARHGLEPSPSDALAMPSPVPVNGSRPGPCRRSLRDLEMRTGATSMPPETANAIE